MVCELPPDIAIDRLVAERRTAVPVQTNERTVPNSVREGNRIESPVAVEGEWEWHDRLQCGGDRGTRTPNLGVANAALSQLSYIPATETTDNYSACRNPQTSRRV